MKGGNVLLKAHKRLFAGIAFLVIQVIVFLVNGFPKFDSGAYELGYLVGSLAPGAIGLVLIAVYFLTKNKAE